MLENENMKRKLFNAQCVKIMGWKRGDYSADIMYFDGVSGERIMAVEDYNPYDDLVQMMPVVDVLCGALGLHLNSGTIQRKGLLEAARELILDTILSGADAEDESEEFDELYHNLKQISDSFQIDTILPHGTDNKEVIKGCVGKERFWETDTVAELEFNKFCADTMWIDCVEKITPYEDSAGEHIRTVLHSKTDDVLYDPYNNIKQLGTVIKQLYGIDNPDLDPFVPDNSAHVPEDVILKSWRKYVISNMPSSNPIQWNTDFLFNLTDAQLNDAYDPDPLDVEEGWDEYDKSLNKVFNKIPNIKQEQKEFNILCGRIMHMHAHTQGNTLLLKDFDPYYNANETINVLEIVLQYLPSSIKFPIHGRAAYDDPAERNILKDMQKFIQLYGTDEYMLPPAVAFNKMCATIVEGFNIVDCLPIDVDFDPYNNIQDLAPIIPIIARRVSEHFTLGDIMYDVIVIEDSYNMDVFGNMRHYAERHGPAIIKLLENKE